jgi:hypothetical protein
MTAEFDIKAEAYRVIALLQLQFATGRSVGWSTILMDARP